MFPMTALHRLAALRGEGLRPDLLELLVHARPAGPNIVPLPAGCEGMAGQAGPNPKGAVPEALPQNVVRLNPRRSGK